MVARRFLVHHNDQYLPIDYDTDDGLQVLKFQIFSLTSVLPDDQKLLVEDEGVVVTEESDLSSVSEKLRLVSIEEEVEREKLKAEVAKSDEEFARRLQAEEEALMLQQYMVIDNGQEFRHRVEPYVQQVLMYEDHVRQEAARKSVPVDELEEKALVSLAKEGNFKPSKAEKDHTFLLQLLFWFKQSFSWVNSPLCENCGSETNNIGGGQPIPSEIKYGASHVELYRCNICSRITRFPRYNDPLKLVETRKGRCGEWANCFTLYCRAFGYDSRLILDFTDHVWTECFSPFLGRWMHLDPCEGVYDNPLLYENGWNKKLNYAIAISKDGVVDVTKRYTRKWHEVLTRRNITTEATVSSILSSITKGRRSGYPSEVLSRLASRDKSEAEELDREIHPQVGALVSLPGRQSGSVEWRKTRNELGSNDRNSFASSSCPDRKCVDDHVTKIYDAYSLLCTHFLENGFSVAKSIETLELLQSLLLNVKAKSFKDRKVFYDQNASDSSDIMAIPPIGKLLSAISLKQDLVDNRRCVSLSGDPIQTSISLPVALDAVKELIDNVKYNKLHEQDMQFPKVNRVSCASVLASGEQLPIGIATSAFDGLLATKWEEPNGAKGCWLMYKLTDGKMYELESYDFISANDAPERDPLDWILEGSQDGGQIWTVLDEKNSEFFERRFQRKIYRVERSFMANEFRFRFLAVKDSNGNSRFQIGSINLYAKGS